LYCIYEDLRVFDARKIKILHEMLYELFNSEESTFKSVRWGILKRKQETE
jgi:hypothetical protein